MASVLIISANSDMAKACARLYAENGHDLILTSRNLEETENLARDIMIRYDRTVTSLYLDVEDISSHQSFFENLINEHQLEGCICFTGYLGDQQSSQSDSKELNKITVSNYLGPASILEIVAAYLEKEKTGFIIGISSVAGDRGRRSNYHYGAAKAAFTAFLSGLRNRLQENNVHVLTVKPGFVNTRMTSSMDLPPLLTAEPEQVAKAIYKANKKGKNIIYVKPVWLLIMLIIKHIPEFIFKKTDI